MSKRKRRSGINVSPEWQAQVEAGLDRLATYNAERARGLVHTPEWDERMAKAQAQFDEDTAMQAHYAAENHTADRRKRINLK